MAGLVADASNDEGAPPHHHALAYDRRGCAGIHRNMWTQMSGVLPTWNQARDAPGEWRRRDCRREDRPLCQSESDAGVTVGGSARRS